MIVMQVVDPPQQSIAKGDFTFNSFHSNFLDCLH